MASSSSNPNPIVNTPVAENAAPSLDEGVSLTEDESFPTMDEVVPHPGKPRNDFNYAAEDEPAPALSVMDVAALAAFKIKRRIPEHVKLISAGGDIVHLHRPRYCAF